jgi:methyl-accepting chemotaxis protein
MLMTPEEKERHDRLDRHLEFLAAQQAQLSSDVAELHRVVAEHSRQIAEHSQQIAEHSQQIAALGSQVRSLADSVLRAARMVDERDRQMATKINALIEHDLRSDARIDALIGVVEKYVSGGNKKSQ